jgi:hypothetical protein
MQQVKPPADQIISKWWRHSGFPTDDSTQDHWDGAAMIRENEWPATPDMAHA